MCAYAFYIYISRNNVSISIYRSSIYLNTLELEIRGIEFLQVTAVSKIVTAWWLLFLVINPIIKKERVLSLIPEVVQLCALIQYLVQFFAGLTGALFIIFGLIGAFFLGLYVDRTKKFTETTKISFILSALTSIGFAVVNMF